MTKLIVFTTRCRKNVEEKYADYQHVTKLIRTTYNCLQVLKSLTMCQASLK